jgi:hypothetical protein
MFVEWLCEVTPKYLCSCGLALAPGFMALAFVWTDPGPSCCCKVDELTLRIKTFSRALCYTVSGTLKLVTNMAKPIRASTQLPFLYPPRCFASSRRTFAATTQQAAGGRSARASTTQRPSLQKSFKVAMQEMMKKGDISNDLGLLPGMNLIGSILATSRLTPASQTLSSCPQAQIYHLQCSLLASARESNGTVSRKE